MAQRIAREAVVKAIRADELESEAYAALVFAARTFVPDRGIDFAVYARRRIAGVLRDYRRFLFQANCRGDRVGAPVFEVFETGHDFDERILAMSEEAPVGRALELAEAVEMVIRRLPGSEAVACRSLYVEGKSYAETAASMGCTKGHVSRLHGEALERIRRVHREALVG